MAEALKTFRGSCHCGEYIYEVDLSEKFEPNECNCSFCYKKGALWIVPKPGSFRFVKGDISTLTNYTFGQKTFHHKFCPNCGVQLVSLGFVETPKPGEVKEPITGFNVRSFQYGQGVDVWTIERKQIDGKSWRGSYVTSKFAGPEPTAVIEGSKIYTGSCHCGGVKVALKSKPLDKSSSDKILECNCSICNRYGAAWIYPEKEQVVLEGEDNLGVYLFNTKSFGKTFCKICGVAVHNIRQPISEEQLSAMPEGMRNWVEGSLGLMPFNLRLLNDLNVKDLNVGQFDGYNQTQPRFVEP